MDRTQEQAIAELATQTGAAYEPPEPFAYRSIDKYTTFRAEYAFEGDDIVFHFFPPPECVGWEPRLQWAYWTEHFPVVLERVACEHFETTDPTRLKAAYTQELVSWWLRAHNFPHLNPDYLAEKLLEKMDAALDPFVPAPTPQKTAS